MHVGCATTSLLKTYIGKQSALCTRLHTPLEALSILPEALHMTLAPCQQSRETAGLMLGLSTLLNQWVEAIVASELASEVGRGGGVWQPQRPGRGLNHDSPPAGGGLGHR